MKVQFCRLDNGNFAPAFAHDEEVLAKVKPGTYLFGTFRKTRNPGHHNKAMRLLRDVFENQDRYDNFEDLLVEFKLKAGHYTEHITTKGKLIYLPKSIDFDNLGQDEFEGIYRKFIEIAADTFGLETAWEYL